MGIADVLSLPETSSPSDHPICSKDAVKAEEVLVVCKRTRWEWEQIRCKGRREEAEKKLIKKGIDLDALIHKHNSQKQKEDAIILHFASLGIRVQRVTVDELRCRVSQTSLVLSAGGDGTFLAAASAVTDDTPVIGINTDPAGWLRRTRLGVTIQGSQSGPQLALNDVFVGEKDAAKVSYYEICIDGGPFIKQKSSGILVCTGTGSSAWHKSLNRVDATMVSDVLSIMSSMGVELPSQDSLSQSIMYKLNSRLSFPPDHQYMMYTLREPIFNGTFQEMASRGECQSITLRSRCTNAVLVLDGSRQIPFENGTEAVIYVDANHSLNTLV